jgi:toxin ParE1/3/4
VNVRYTRRALRQTSEALAYIEAQSPQGAKNVKARLQAVIDLLADHPNSGRTTNKSGLRRISTSPYPYVIFYRVNETEIVIHSVRHAARRPV